MALPLLSLEESSAGLLEIGNSYSLSLNSDTLVTLQTSFFNSSSIVPLLFIGQDHPAITTLISKLLYEFGSTPGDNFQITPQEVDSLTCKRPPSETVFVWPRPLVIEEHHILLMRMWDFDMHESVPELRDAVQKTLFCLGAITACGISKFAKNPYPEVKFVQSLWEEVKNRTGLEPADLIVLGEEAALPLSQSLLAQQSSFRSSVYNSRTKFVPERCVENPVRFFREILGEGKPNRFKAALMRASNQLRCMNPIHIITAILKNCVYISNFDFDLPIFLSHIPRFDQGGLEQKNNLLERLRVTQNSIKAACPLSLFTLSENHSQYLFDENQIASLRKNFSLDQPAIVMLTFGRPGVGKSNFLNRIIQHCVQLPRLVPVFKTGNTGDHTTRASQVLSHPVMLPGSDTQMMLIDLEGLGGMELADGQKAVLQQNLVSSLISMASVPCVIVTNEHSIQGPVENYISKMSFCANTFGFAVERVLFLFHDKDYVRGVRQKNEFMMSWITRLNESYFGGRPVIQLMNKPNFVDSSKAEMCEHFLSDFFRLCNFPKKNASGTLVTVREMLTQIKYITEFAHTDLSAISIRSRNGPLEKKCLEDLETMFINLKSSNRKSLVSSYNEKHRIFMSFCPLSQEPPESARFIQVSLENQAQIYRLALTSIDSTFNYVQRMSQEELGKCLKELIYHFYKTTSWIGTFTARCDDLVSKMREVEKRYPSESEKLKAALIEAESERNECKYWFYGIYAAQVVSTVATGALGLAANTSKAAILAARLGYGAIASGLMSIGGMVYNLRSIIVAENAIPLFEITSSRVKWNKKAVENCGGDGSKVVLVVTGRDTAMTVRMLNELVTKMSPLTTTSAEVFKSSEKGQILQLEIPGKDNPAIIIFLPLQSGASHTPKSGRVMERITKALLSRASVACLLENQCSDFTISLIAQISTIDSDEFSPVPHLAIFTIGEMRNEIKTGLSAALSSHMIPLTLKSVDSSQECFLSTIQLDLLECLHSARAMGAQEFRKMIAAAMEIGYDSTEA